MTYRKDKTPLQKELEQEILTLKSKPALIVSISLALMGFLFCYFAYDSISPYAWISWVFALMIMTLIRLKYEPVIFSNKNITVEKKIKIALTLTFFTGIVHGLSLAFFPYFTFSERTVQTLILLGLSSGAIATNSGFLPLYLAYITPIFIPLAFAWSFTSDPNDSWQSQIGIVILIFTYAALQISNAKNYFANFRESYDIRSKLEEAVEQEIFLKEEADFSNNSKTRFLASASHDLRQPIQTLLLLAGNLSNRTLDTANRKIVDSIDSTCTNLSSLLDSLLDISKLDAGLMKSSPKKIDLVWVLRRIHSEFLHDTQLNDIELVLDTDFEEAWTKSDSDLLSRIFRNLISNAIKYTENGQIKITLINKEKNWNVSIKDTGIGISEDKQDRIFEEFYQVGNDQRNREQGLGLGLAIVKRLITNLNLKIDLDSTLGEGSTFSIDFVISNKPNDEFLTHQSINEDDSIASTHILYVEDEKEIREALGTTLIEMGCSVDLTDNAKDSISLAKERRPDIVLADFRLAGSENGIDIITLIRALYPNLPALLISGDTAPERLKHAADAGITMLHKPVHANKIKDAIFKTLYS